MIRFEYSLFLWLLLLVPALAALAAWSNASKRRILASLGNPQLLEKLMPERSDRRAWIKLALFLSGLSFLIIALASPQMGTKQETVKRKGIDLVIALDLSKSMLSEDVAPNRLERAKLLIRELVSRLDGDRVGLVVFAGRAYLQMPLTVDYSSILLYLRSLNTGSIPTPGTAVGEALRQAEKAFEAGETKHKAIVLISDGEDHQPDAIEYARQVASAGTVIHTVGAGTPGGGTIPEIDANGNRMGVKKDAEGKVVVTRLNERMLEDLAKAGNGQYYTLDRAKEVAGFLAKDIAKLETKTINDKVYTDFVSQYQYFLALGLICLVADMLIPYRKRTAV